MLIPIGHEQTSVRRWPWVTFAVMAVCLVALVATNATMAGIIDDLNRRYEDAKQYFVHHPYLEITPDFLALLVSGGEEAGRRAVEELRDQSGAVAPEEGELLSAEQSRLDALVADLFEAIDQMPYRRWGLIPARVTASTLLTHMFMHGGWMHLIGNMLFLFIAGPFIEDVWGRPLFLAFYTCAGLFAAIMFALRYPAMEGPMLGASGAVAGVMGAFLIRYWRTRLRFFVWPFSFFMGTLTAPAWLMLSLWFLREMFSAYGKDVQAPQAGGGVAYWAHVWGFVFGVAVAYAMQRLRVEQRFIHSAIEAKITLVDNPVVEKAHEAAGRGRVEEALNMLRGAVASDPDNIDSVVAFWNLAASHGAEAEAAPDLLHVVRLAARRGDLEPILAHWQDLVRSGVELDVEAPLAIRIAEVQASLPGGLDQARETVAVAARATNATTPSGSLFRLARLAVRLGSPDSEALIGRALTAPELPDDARQELEELLGRSLAVAAPGNDASPSEGLLAEMSAPAPPAGKVIRPVECVPVTLDHGVLTVRRGESERRIGLEEVHAVSVAGIRGTRPYLVVDLLLDPTSGVGAELRVIRVRSSSFDPRGIVGQTSIQDAFRAFVGRLLNLSNAVPLPDHDRALGRPFAVYESLEEYEEEVLGVG